MLGGVSTPPLPTLNSSIMLLPDPQKLSSSGKRLLKRIQGGGAKEKDRFTSAHFKSYSDFYNYEKDKGTETFLDQFSSIEGESRILDQEKFFRFIQDVSDRLSQAEVEISELKYRLDNV